MPSEHFVYDPARPDFASRAYDVYRELRDHHRVYHNPERGFYALSHFEDVRKAANDPASFSSESTSISVGILPMMQQLDPPRHDSLRALVQRAFTARRVAEMEPRVREIARELIDAFLARGRCDLQHAFAAQLPSRVIGELIGVPPERREAFLEWTQAMVATGPAGTTQGDVIRNPAQQIYAEFSKLLPERRAERRDDLMSALLDAEFDGRQLSEEELLGFCFLLIVAGQAGARPASHGVRPQRVGDPSAGRPHEEEVFPRCRRAEGSEVSIHELPGPGAEPWRPYR